MVRSKRGKIFRWLIHLIVVLSSIIATATTFWGAYETYRLVKNYIRRPQIYIGVLPYWEIRNKKVSKKMIGNFDRGHEFSFNRAVLAVPVNAVGKNIFTGLDSSTFIFNRRIRASKKVKNNYVIELPIIVVNYGKDNLHDMEIMISFKDVEKELEIGKPDSRIRVVDFSVEGMETIEIFADPSSFSTRRGREKYRKVLPTQSIYNDYQELGAVENTVSVTGELEGESFAMMHVRLFFPITVKKFAVTYQIYSDQKYFNRKNLGQFIYLE